MKGLELSEQYYLTYGKKMLEEQFPNIVGQTAVGLVGRGSECLGFDDEISKDHDYGPSFCIWLPKNIYQEYGSRVQAAYDALPREFMGFSAREIEEQGKDRVGVLCLEDFYYSLLGRESAPETNEEWLSLSDLNLSAATNGKVFEDRLGQFSAFRNALLRYYPEDVRRKKIVGCMARAAQSGQYNYARAMKRGERITAELALTDFIREIMQLTYLLNRRYAPFYKWMHRGMKELATCFEIGDMIELFYKIPDPSAAWEGVAPQDYLYNLNTNDGRVLIIEAICNIIVQELNTQGLSDLQDNFLQNHLSTVTEKIQDEKIRRLQYMEG